jgi:hypothetical protein
MKKKIINFFSNRKAFAFLISTCSFFITYILFLTIFGYMNVWHSLMAELGWGVMLLSTYYFHEKCSFIKSDLVQTRINTLDYSNEILKNVIKELNATCKYNETLSNSVSLYSNLVKSIGKDNANAIIEFASSTKINDTVFLIRLDHENSIWYFNVAGANIHVDLATIILNMAIRKVTDIAGEDGQIKAFYKISN